MSVAVDRKAERTRDAAIALVDGDIHPNPKSVKALGRYMPARWRRHHETFGPRGHGGAYYPRANDNAARTDSWPPSGDPPGSDLPFLREQLVDAWHIDVGVLNALGPAAGLQRNLEYSAALASAMNEWLQAEWLDPEPRLRASMIVPGEAGDLAAAEIRRRAAQPGFVQVLLHVRTAEPLGRRRYWPMYEAAVEHDMPIGLHFGGAGGSPITGAGWPSFYIEDHAGMPVAFQSQVLSLVAEGVFERFPTLKIVLIEGGFGWLAPLMWRLDNAYRWLREEVPHLRRPPSEYIREHFWLTTQPMEEPERAEHFHALLGHLGMDDRLMFATDYPHWDFDAPDQAIPARLEPDLEAAIMAGNACRLYRL
jgi:predicted TIM-barrel fold metal-dependent hydrolase